MTPVLIGALCGAFGQGIRAAIGFVKVGAAIPTFTDGDPAATLPAINWTRLAATTVIGAVAGVVGAFLHPDPLFLIACGYAGTDAIEGILKAAGPKA